MQAAAASSSNSVSSSGGTEQRTAVAAQAEEEGGSSPLPPLSLSSPSVSLHDEGCTRLNTATDNCPMLSLPLACPLLLGLSLEEFDPA